MRARVGQVCHSQRHSLTTGRSSDTFDAPEVADHGNLQRPPNTSHAPAQSRAPPHHEHERRPNDPLARAINDVFLQHPHPLPAVDTAASYRRPSHDPSLSNPLRPADPPNRLSDNSHTTDDIAPTTLRPSGQDPLNDYARGHQTPDDHSQVVDSEDEDENTMPTRRTSTVDLTQSPNRAAPSASHQSRTRRRSSAVDEADDGPVRKRSKRVAASAARVDMEEKEEEDEDEAPSADAELLQAQQRDALKMQDSNEDEGAKIGQKSCIICLENYTNATASSCGRHIRTVNLMFWNGTDREYRSHLLPRMPDPCHYGVGEERRPCQG